MYDAFNGHNRAVSTCLAPLHHGPTGILSVVDDSNTAGTDSERRDSGPLNSGRRSAAQRLVRLGGTLVLLASFWMAAPAQAAERQHTVLGGQTMAGIAQRYGVTVWSLAAANKLKPDEQVRVGQVLSVPDKGAVYVNPGQTLWSVARRHRVSVDALAQCNGLTVTASLRPGMRLALPSHTDSRPASASSSSNAKTTANAKGSQAASGGSRTWGKAKQNGRVQLYRVATQKSLTVTLADSRGRIRPGVGNRLAEFLRPRDSKKTKAPQRRLLALLAQTSDHFGGRRLHVVSGYRLAKGYTKHESRHVMGAALDFRVEGIPNHVLRDYLRHFDDVGVGFYPNSSFVHFDVRDRNAYWIDLSGAGQRPNYLGRAARDTYDEAQRLPTTDTPIVELVESAIEEMQHGEPEDADVDDE